eukprot:gene9489-500_t
MLPAPPAFHHISTLSVFPAPQFARPAAPVTEAVPPGDGLPGEQAVLAGGYAQSKYGARRVMGGAAAGAVAEHCG